MNMNELLDFVKQRKASDLHLSVGQPPMLRIDGDIVPLRVGALKPEEVKALLSALMNEEQRAIYEKDLEIDFALHYNEGVRFRVNAFHTLLGPAAALRYIPVEIKSIEELGMPEILKKFASLTKGLVLITGATGSGKSTTLAAMVDYINSHFAKHILTIEDPIEFMHRSNKSLINQREVFTHTASFDQALKSALREDPDVILVGELRDKETIQLALTAAETGHLVLATLHTGSASKTIDRIIDVFSGDDKEMVKTMLSASLEVVISQALLKRADGEGRVAAYEVMVATSAVRNLIRDNRIPQLYSLIQVGSNAGMNTMEDCVEDLLSKELITSEVAKSAIEVSKHKVGAASLSTSSNPENF